MSDKQSRLIKRSIDDIINQQIKQEELRERLLKFVDYQSEKGLPFGELLVLHYALFNGAETEEIYLVAAAVEILILSFDMLDDFEDDDCKNKPWSSQFNLSLNATTALLFLSSSIIRNTNFENKDRAITLLLRYGLRSINGQHKDLLNSCRNEADYIEMTMEKSGSLVALACLIGAALATDDYPEEIEVYANLIGLIGQINNDLIDISTWNDKNDLLNRKFTLPIIYLLNYKDDELQIVHEYYNNQLDKSAIIENRNLIDNWYVETGAIAYTEIIKKLHQNKALAVIKRLNLDQDYLDQLLKYI